MVKTASEMLPLGTPMPDFSLPVVETTNFIATSPLHGLKTLNSTMFEEKIILLMIICAHCPFVKHIESELTNLEREYGKLIQMIAVSSNSLITHPQDAPEYLLLQANEAGWHFPYLFDSDQTLAKDLKAACTPDFFLFAPAKDRVSRLQYRGQLDGSRPGNDVSLTGQDLRGAFEALLNGKAVSSDQKPSIGCNIKWHPGKEPSWFR